MDFCPVADRQTESDAYKQSHNRIGGLKNYKIPVKLFLNKLELLSYNQDFTGRGQLGC